MLVLLREPPLLTTSVSPRPDTCFQVYALFRYGETTLSACAFQVAPVTGISQTISKTNENQRDPSVKTTGKWTTIEETNKTIKSSFQDQCVATKHRGNQPKQEHQDFRINGYQKPSRKLNNNKTTKISGPMVVTQNHWSWNLGFLFVLCFIDGFRYPLILTSWFSCVVWFSLWFLLHIDPEIFLFVCLVSSMLFHFPVVFTLGSLWFSLVLPTYFAFTVLPKLHHIFHSSRSLFPLPARMHDVTGGAFAGQHTYCICNTCVLVQRRALFDNCHSKVFLSSRREHHLQVSWLLLT